jgi:hypothetical protein
MARPRDGKPMRRLSSSVAEATYLRLEDIAALEQRSVAQIVRRAVEEFITKYGSLDQARLPLQRRPSGPSQA